MTGSNAPGVVIIGGGQAGLEAAAALRTQGYQGPVTIICEEPVAPYQRPPLSKDYLQGKQAADSLPLRGDAYYQNHHVDLLLGETVVAIDRGQKSVRIASGPAISYAKLIFATGARNRELALEGSGRVRYLRSLPESDFLKQAMPQAKSVAVIGGGFIGLEVAAAARVHGRPVTVIEAAPRLMARAVPQIVSEFFLVLHQSQSVDVRLNARISSISEDAVILEDGTVVAADLVVAGIGVEPNHQLAAEAGLTTGNGVAVDAFLRTSDSDIYAIGDCAEHPNAFAHGSIRNVRLESVQNAVDQAKCVAKGIVASLNQTEPAPYADVPWFWTDQFGVRFQMAGLWEGHDREVLRGSLADHKFSVFYFVGDKLIAVDSINRFGDHIVARKLLARGATLTPEQAADESVDLKKL